MDYKLWLLMKIGSMIHRLRLSKFKKCKNDKRATFPYKLMYFCGNKGIEYLNCSLVSIYKKWKTLPDLIIVTDGTPIQEIENRMIKWPKKVELFTWEYCANYFLSNGNINLYNYAKNELWGKKLISILAFAVNEPILYSDTDVLWYSDPSDLFTSESHSSPSIRMSQDKEFCYSTTMLNELNEDAILNQKPLNAGIIYIDGDFSVYKKWDLLCAYLGKKSDNRTEQTTFAILTNYYGKPWSMNQIYLNTADIKNVCIVKKEINYIARHYVNTKGWLFWRDFVISFLLSE